ncbi:hypothetical protein RTBOTA2_000904, partial [Rhodotorula toruloides]
CPRPPTPSSSARDLSADEERERREKRRRESVRKRRCHFEEECRHRPVACGVTRQARACKLTLKANFTNSQYDQQAAPDSPEPEQNRQATQ